MDRLWGCHFAAAVFTNLTREHMDYHKTFDDYFAAKRRLFIGTGAGVPEVAVINVDDEYGKRLAGFAKTTVTYGLESAADITTKKFQLTFSGLSFTRADAERQGSGIVAAGRPHQRLQHSCSDWRGAGAGPVRTKSSRRAFEIWRVFPGGSSASILGQPYFVVVDYAHTDDALESLIRTARELNPKGRIITLFGCGGGKDRTKRPVMGEAAGRLSDLTILSNDNPKTEDPLKIISDIVVGLQKTNGKYMIEPDREKSHRPGDGSSAPRRHRFAGRQRPRELPDSWPIALWSLTIANRRDAS